MCVYVYIYIYIYIYITPRFSYVHHFCIHLCVCLLKYVLVYMHASLCVHTRICALTQSMYVWAFRYTIDTHTNIQIHVWLTIKTAKPLTPWYSELDQSSGVWIVGEFFMEVVFDCKQSYTYIYIYIRIYSHIYMYVCMHVYIHIYIYTYIYGAFKVMLEPQRVVEQIYRAWWIRRKTYTNIHVNEHSMKMACRRKATNAKALFKHKRLWRRWARTEATIAYSDMESKKQATCERREDNTEHGTRNEHA
jgi:hypothetical protein